jgi:hypothetical protein
MWPELAALVAQTPLELGKPGSQVIKHRTEGPGTDLHLAQLAHVVPKRCGKEETRAHATSATRTERISGRWPAIIAQLSPSSLLAKTSPSRVPK